MRSLSRMKTAQAIRSYYVMPCCLLLLNACVELVGYKARAFDEPFLTVLAIMGMVLFGGSFVAYLVSPAIESVINKAYKGSRKGGGGLGELLFLLVLGGLVFWLYYLIYIVGPESVLPTAWHNAPPHRL
jgi:hypothetical protein